MIKDHILMLRKGWIVCIIPVAYLIFPHGRIIKLIIIILSEITDRNQIII